MSTKPPERVSEPAGDFVQLWAAGDTGKGDYRCSECDYGVTVYRTLPVCPMCSGTSWEQAAWSPFGRAARLSRGA